MKKERIYSLDFLRILAAIGIVFFHYPASNKILFGLDFSSSNTNWSYLVEFFFLLSGYMMLGYVKRIENGLSFPQFFVRRLIRLLPVAALSTAVFSIILVMYHVTFGTVWDWGSITLWETLVTCLGIQNGGMFLYSTNNSHLWYLSVLLICYAVFFFVTWLFSQKGFPRTYAYLLMIALGLSIQTYGINLPFLNASTARAYVAFFVGLMLSRISENRWQSRMSCLYSFAIITFMNVLFFRFFWVVEDGLVNNLIFVYYPALVIFFRSDPIRKCFHFPILGTLGEITYGVYIWHYGMIPLMQVTLAQLGWDVYTGSIKGMLIFTVLSFVAGALSYYFIEKPTQKYLERKWISYQKAGDRD